MRNALPILILLLFISINSFAQDYWHTETQNLNSNNFRKGSITLSGGKSIKFKNLSIGDDVISYTDMQGQHQEQQKSEVFKIIKTGNYADVGIIIGSLSGALTGIQWDRALDEAWGEDVDRTNLICYVRSLALQLMD